MKTFLKFILLAFLGFSSLFSSDEEVDSRGLFSSFDFYETSLLVNEINTNEKIIHTNWGISFRLLKKILPSDKKTVEEAILSWEEGDQVVPYVFYPEANEGNRPLAAYVLLMNVRTKQLIKASISRIDPSYQENSIVSLYQKPFFRTLSLVDGSEWAESAPLLASSKFKKWKEGEHVLPVLGKGVFTDYWYLLNLERSEIIEVKMDRGPRQ